VSLATLAAPAAKRQDLRHLTSIQPPVSGRQRAAYPASVPSTHFHAASDPAEPSTHIPICRRRDPVFGPSHPHPAHDGVPWSASPAQNVPLETIFENGSNMQRHGQEKPKKVMPVSRGWGWAILRRVITQQHFDAGLALHASWSSRMLCFGLRC
jgi:hypothetical protein